MRLLVALAALALVAAGCVSAPEQPPADEGASPSTDVALPGGGLMHSIGAQGALSALHLAEGGPVKVTFPEGVLVQGEDGRLLPPEGPVEIPAGGAVSYLAPFMKANLTVGVENNGVSEDVTLALPEGEPLVSGDLAVELLKVQRDQFPDRRPGEPSFDASVAYFEQFFKDLGYEVVVERAPAGGGNVGPLNVAPDSFTNVVAYKRGASDRIIGFGGHFDVVEETRDGAFDNTAGTVATMVVAKAFQNVTTQHTLMFGLWGGEEDGILGSQAYLARNPDKIPLFDAYVNFDVTAIAWPAPKVEPARIILAAGPDGPVADTLHGYGAVIEQTYLGLPAGTFVPEGVAQGQAQGAGVNAQSDHTPFMSRGIPVYFQFTERVDDVLSIIHSDLDTVDNLTKYALLGLDAMANEDEVLTPEQVEEGEWYLARSFETQMYFGVYFALLTDAGVFPPAGAGGALPVSPPVLL